MAAGKSSAGVGEEFVFRGDLLRGSSLAGSGSPPRVGIRERQCRSAAGILRGGPPRWLLITGLGALFAVSRGVARQFANRDGGAFPPGCTHWTIFFICIAKNGFMLSVDLKKRIKALAGRITAG